MGSTWSKITPSSGLLTLSQGYGLSKNKILASQKFLSNPFISIELNQPLSKGGRLQQKLALINGDSEFELANIDYRITEEQLIFDCLNNYYQLVRIKRLVKQAEEQVKLSQQLLKWAEARLKAGQIPRLDVMNAQIQLFNDSDFLIQVQEDKKTFQRRFLQLLGLNEDTEIDLNEEIKIMVLNKEIDESIDEAIKNGPDMQKAKIEVLQIKRNVDIAQSTNKPILNILGNYSWMNEAKELEEAVKDLPYRNWFIEAKIFFPFFDSGATKNQVKIAEINYRRVQEAFLKLKKDIIEEIREIYCNLEKTKKRIGILEENIKIAEKARKISELKYQQGLTTIREVLESQIVYYKAKSLLDDTKIDYLIAKARLFKKIGRLKDEYLK